MAKTGANTNPNPVDEDGAGVPVAEVVVVAEVVEVAEVLVLAVPDEVADVEVADVEVADVEVADVEVADVVVVVVVAVVAVEEDEDVAAQDPEGFPLKVAVYLEQVDLVLQRLVVLILQLPVKYELQAVSTSSQRLWQGPYS